MTDCDRLIMAGDAKLSPANESSVRRFIISKFLASQPLIESDRSTQ